MSLNEEGSDTFIDVHEDSKKENVNVRDGIITSKPNTHT